jgi:hypothetical protein
MAGNNKCTCEGTRKERMLNWRRLSEYYKTNYSYFEHPKGEAHRSNYSTVICLKCEMSIRTKADWIEQLEFTNLDEINNSRSNCE